MWKIDSLEFNKSEEWQNKTLLFIKSKDFGFPTWGHVLVENQEENQ